MLIKYFNAFGEYANRTSDIVPRQGELVRFQGIIYVIKTVVWVEDESRKVVHIEIVPEKQPEEE